ncbi:MAG: aminoacyl-tRNA hydrolase [Candidatus Margulisiibacteriota bacterium]
MALKLIVGLGNPGDNYALTRHNIGFKFINELNKQSEVEVHKKVTLKSHLFRPVINGQQIMVIKPQTYMNLSGEAVVAVMNYYKIQPSEICIVTDDLDVAFGRLRIRKKGGAGTHNGMKSIISRLGSQDFLRVRLGIGPKPEFLDSKDFVLQRFNDSELKEMPILLNRMVRSFCEVIHDPYDLIMNRLNPVLYH